MPLSKLGRPLDLWKLGSSHYVGRHSSVAILSSHGALRFVRIFCSLFFNDATVDWATGHGHLASALRARTGPHQRQHHAVLERGEPRPPRGQGRPHQLVGGQRDAGKASASASSKSSSSTRTSARTSCVCARVPSFLSFAHRSRSVFMFLTLLFCFQFSMRSRTPSINGSVCPSPYGSMHKKVADFFCSFSFLRCHSSLPVARSPRPD